MSAHAYPGLPCLHLTGLACCCLSTKVSQFCIGHLALPILIMTFCCCAVLQCCLSAAAPPFSLFFCTECHHHLVVECPSCLMLAVLDFLGPTSSFPGRANKLLCPGYTSTSFSCLHSLLPWPLNPWSLSSGLSSRTDPCSLRIAHCQHAPPLAPFGCQMNLTWSLSIAWQILKHDVHHVVGKPVDPCLWSYSCSISRARCSTFARSVCGPRAIGGIASPCLSSWWISYHGGRRNYGKLWSAFMHNETRGACELLSSRPSSGNSSETACRRDH